MSRGGTQNLGQELQRAASSLQSGKPKKALQITKAILRKAPRNFDALHLGAIATRQQGNLDEAVKLFKAAIEIRNDHPDLFYNFGNTLTELGQYDEAVVGYRRALELNPDHAVAHLNLGNALNDLKRYDEAVASYLRALELMPDSAGGHHNLGRVLTQLKRYDEAVASQKRALALKPEYGSALEELANGIRQICDWQDYAGLEAKLKENQKLESDPIHPLDFTAFYDEPDEFFQCAKRYARAKTGSVTAFKPIEPWVPDGPVRVAYLSGDFRDHPVAYLTAELFERHDANKFELHAVSLSPKGKSAIGTRLEQAFDHWHDVHTMSDRDVADLIRELKIEILVDLTGYTLHGRPILAYEPAPIQVNYLGYPGSMGADFVDYILVDSFLTPPGQDAFFSEKLVRLPNSFMVHDSKREIAEETPTRGDCGLADDAFVFCSFNRSHKITPAIFDIWMRLLEKTPGSVLWLSGTNGWAEENLGKEAARRNVDPDRLVFAPRVDEISEHLARHRQADLFVDTLPYNAHATASDALWAGLPVLTCAGRSFPARVSGSLLHAVGLPELVTTNLSDYEALALKLAHEPELLAGYRKRLGDKRTTAPLFDCRRFTRNLETAYIQMRQRWQAGKPPVAFSVSEDAS